MTDGSSSINRTGRFSPLRYPGGKGKLSTFVSALIKSNRLSDGTYVEPYAGGAAIAWELLLTGVVRRVEINDLSRPIFAFWHSALYETDDLCRLIKETDIDVSTWDRSKAVFTDAENVSLLELGFATFFLNRTNRSGILNGGIIGGREQTGRWKIDARFNRDRLISQIQKIGAVSRRVTLSNTDAADFITAGAERWSSKTLVYLDPPYFVKGGQLYYDSYGPSDHAIIAQVVHQHLHTTNWIVSYDDVNQIRELYNFDSMLAYEIGYSARTASAGRECMFFSPQLKVPEVTGSMIESERRLAA